MSQNGHGDNRHRTHALRRTSAPGQPWLGSCSLCGGVGFAQYQAGEYCPGKKEGNHTGAGTVDKITGAEDRGRGRRQFRDRGEHWSEIDGGDTSLGGPRSRPRYAQDAIGVPRDQWVIGDPAGAKHRQKGFWESLWDRCFGWLGRDKNK